MYTTDRRHFNTDRLHHAYRLKMMTELKLIKTNIHHTTVVRKKVTIKNV